MLDVTWKLKPPSPAAPKDEDTTEGEAVKEWKRGDYVIAWPTSKKDNDTEQQDDDYRLWLSSVRAAVQTVAFAQNTQVLLEAWVSNDMGASQSQFDKSRSLWHNRGIWPTASITSVCGAGVVWQYKGRRRRRRSYFAAPPLFTCSSNQPIEVAVSVVWHWR